MIRTFITVWLLLFSTQLFAGEALFFGIRPQYNGTRAMGMGGAFTAVADDNTAIFYNPAGLIQLEKGESNWYMKFEGDPEIAEFYDEIERAKETPPVGQSEEEALSDVLQKNYGSHYSLRMPSLGWLWARPNWGLAVIPMDFSIDMGLHRTVGPSVNLYAVNDTTVAFTYNWDVIPDKFYGKLSVGITTKAIYRMEVNKVASIAEVNQGEIFQPEDAREGFTIDADVGVLWRAPWERWNLKGAMVIRNILDYGYLTQFSVVGDESGQPGNLNRTIDFGGALELPGFITFKHRIAVDYRDLLHPNFTFKKGIHVGYEFNGQLFSWLKGAFRAGINQGYWTAGWTGEFTIFRLDLASYGEEVGVPGSPIENRRYMMTTSLDF